MGDIATPGQAARALDRTVWTEFHETPTETVAASEERLRTLFDADDGRK